MADKPSEDDETREEAAQAAETGETPAEAHRAGEYDELKELIDTLIRKVDALSSFVADKAINEPAAPAENEEEPRLLDLDEIDFE